MIRRPKATDTEEDLLAFQEKFISSGEKPSASVDAQRKVKVGSKRVQQASQDTTETVSQARDVIDLQMEAGGIAKPRPKRSKFKEQRLKAKELKSSQDQHEIMESQDAHIMKILSEIKEHDTQGHAMPPPRYTRGGFPSVQALEPTGAAETSKSGTESVKKSLFAQQFEAHGPSYFGVEPGGREEGPVTEGEAEEDSEKHKEKISTGQRLNFSSLISGDGLVSAGVSLEVAKDEVMKIHEENVERLSSLSAEEIKKERERIQQQIDPSLLAFIKSRHHQKQQLKTFGGDHVTSAGDHVTTEQGSKPTHSPDVIDPSSAQPLPTELATPTSWVHMDVVEREKMEWMTDISVHAPRGDAPADKGSNEIRFSLEGLAIPRSVVLPDHLSLHHHGDEPQAAGYTLSELLSLCRSTVLQQRTFSLQLLAKVIQRARLNEYGSVSCEASDPGGAGGAGDSVLEQLLSTDVPLLLRYSLDESVGSVMFAAAACLHSLLVIPLENTVLDEYSLCHLGCVLPALRSPDRSHDQQSKEERDNESDAETLHHDIILGYLKMKLLHRVRYILEVCAPPTPLPSHLLDVVTRITRHSLYAATEVFSCPRLMDVIFGHFLPLDWSTDKVGVVNGKACLSAMRLVHALCSASRNITTSLLSRYKLSSVLVRYGVPRPSELGLPEELAYPLSTAALLTWSVVLGYGLASETFRDTYSELLKQLVSVSAVNPSPVEAQRDRALLCLVEAALCVAAISPDKLKMEGTADTHPPPAIDWSHAQGLQSPLISLLQQLPTSSEDAPCVGNVLHCLATLHSLTPPNVSPVDRLEEVGQLVEGPLSCLVESSLFTQALQTLRDTSSLITPPHTSTPPPPSLPSHLTLSIPPKPALYGSPTMQPADYRSLVQSRLLSMTAAHLVWGCVRLIRECLHVNKAVVGKVTTLVSNPIYLEYLNRVAHSQGSKISTFDLVELYLLYDTVKYLQSCMELGVSLPDGCGQLTFDLAHYLLKLLPPGLECLVWDLLSTVALHSSLIGTQNQSLFLEQDVTSLSLKDQPQPITFQDSPMVSMTTSQLLASALRNLPTIQSVYLRAMKEGGWCSMTKLVRSESIVCGHPLQASSKLLPPCHTHILPEDWVLSPIIQEYNRTTSSQRVADTANSSEMLVSTVTCSLQLLLLLEHIHPHLLARLPTSAKLSRLMCVFLIGVIDSEIFLEKVVHDLLSSLLSLYCREAGELDFSSPVPGLASFADLYSSLLEQFSAVSYGDHLFSCYLLLPLQQRFSAHLRKMVWGEHPAIIRVFSLPLAEVPVVIDNFLVPTETDLQLLDMYLSALSAQTVRPTWSPVFYLMAVHHVHSFLFGEGDSLGKRRETMLLRVLKMANQETKRDLLLYAGVDVTSPKGLKLRDKLDEGQSDIITSLLGTTDGVM